MEKKSIRKQPFAAKFYLSMLLFLTFSSAFAYADVDPVIMQSYQLRMSGKADAAEALLIRHLETDSTNAMTWFELARTKNHIFNSKQELSPDEWTGITNIAEKAAKLDPKNEVYAYYYSFCRLLDAFISLMQGNQDAGVKVKTAADAFQSVVNINPACTPAMLYQMDIYGLLPPEMGGDKELANAVLERLKSHDKTCYEIARTRLLPDTADFAAFWLEAAKNTGINAQVLEETGRGFLFKSDNEKGEQYYNEAIKADPSKSYLRMNLARYYMMRSQDPANRENYLKKAEDLVNSYIASNPEPLPTLKAHAYAILAMLSSFKGDQDSVTKYNDLATAIDPFCSKASGMPPEIVYYPPDEVKIKYVSLFMPF